MFTQPQYRYWLPIEGESIEALFITKEETTALDSTRRVVYLFENQSGMFALRATPSLDEQMAVVAPNDRVRIEFLGLRPATDFVQYPAYRVFVNHWVPLSEAEEYDKDGILLL
jgi:hypothetical protein